MPPLPINSLTFDYLIAGGTMQYHNATDVLPPRLLRAVQLYAGGKLLYIPTNDVSKSKWGGRNGARLRYLERNAEIRTRFLNGEALGDLADSYYLSEDSIRKIVRRS
jgi:Mor family transcriptional regulator